MQILIVKTSSLGDIIQALPVLKALKGKFPQAKIDWVVEKKWAHLLERVELIDQVIPIDSKKILTFFRMKKKRYDLLFDLQGNIKSGVITFLSKADKKIGFGGKTAKEWPNTFFTSDRFEVDKRQNIQSFYLSLLEKFFSADFQNTPRQIDFTLFDEEKKSVDQILSKGNDRLKVMICLGSNWPNKKIGEKALSQFLRKIDAHYRPSFFFMWGNLGEKQECKRIRSKVEHGIIVDKLLIPQWQYMIQKMDLMIALDSSALHLCATTQTPSFSIFGPTAKDVFKPDGENHSGIQGVCPYQVRFIKQCPYLRSCLTGACIKNLHAEQLFQALQSQCAFLQPALQH